MSTKIGKEDKKWYTVTPCGKHETVMKEQKPWEELGYKIKETETEVLLTK